MRSSSMQQGFRYSRQVHLGRGKGLAASFVFLGFPFAHSLIDGLCETRRVESSQPTPLSPPPFPNINTNSQPNLASPTSRLFAAIPHHRRPLRDACNRTPRHTQSFWQPGRVALLCVRCPEESSVASWPLGGRPIGPAPLALGGSLDSQSRLSQLPRSPGQPKLQLPRPIAFKRRIWSETRVVIVPLVLRPPSSCLHDNGRAEGASWTRTGSISEPIRISGALVDWCQRR